MYFFYLYTTIRQKYMVLFRLFFIFCTTIRQKIRVFIYLFFICTRPFDLIIGSSFIYSFFSARPFDQKLGSSLIYFFHLHTTIRQKDMIFFLSFILSLCTVIRPKNRVLINLLFLFVHDHSTKLGVTLILLFILFLGVPIFRLLHSWQIMPLYFHRFVSGSIAFIFRQLYS